MRTKDSILRQQVFILQQKLLIHRPVTYANRRATCVFFIETHHHTFFVFTAFQFFDRTGSQNRGAFLN